MTVTGMLLVQESNKSSHPARQIRGVLHAPVPDLIAPGRNTPGAPAAYLREEGRKLYTGSASEVAPAVPLPPPASLANAAPKSSFGAELSPTPNRNTGVPVASPSLPGWVGGEPNPTAGAVPPRATAGALLPVACVLPKEKAAVVLGGACKGCLLPKLNNGPVLAAARAEPKVDEGTEAAEGCDFPKVKAGVEPPAVPALPKTKAGAEAPAVPELPKAKAGVEAPV